MQATPAKRTVQGCVEPGRHRSHCCHRLIQAHDPLTFTQQVPVKPERINPPRTPELHLTYVSQGDRDAQERGCGMLIIQIKRLQSTAPTVTGLL